MKEEEFLKERAEKFLKEAEDDIKKGFFDLAAFHLEQALQLKLKYFLAKKIGYFSKTHLLSELIKEVGKINKEVKKIAEKNKRSIEELEIAYTASRYLPIRYSKEKVEELLIVVKKFFEVINL
jgi:HEPN domain-containing protein